MKEGHIGHPVRRTRAEIDLDLLRTNIETLWKRAGSRGYMILLKADAYGHGAIACAKLAGKLGVDFGGVAVFQEAFYLRRAGVDLPLLVLEDLFDDEISPALHEDVSLAASSLAYVEKVAAAAERSSRTGKIHINVDTGMGRLGCFPDELEEIARFVHRCEWLLLEGIFTHFPASDEGVPSGPRKQLEIFGALLDSLADDGIHPRWRHAANSGAVLDLPSESCLDMVRPGVATFGLHPSGRVDHGTGIMQVMKLKSAVISVKSFPAGSGIGYGSAFITSRESRIGVVPIGYGDGYLRRLSGKSEVLVHGLRAPVVGRVSMDMITIDLTDIPEPVNRGDEVVLAGKQEWEERAASLSIEELAERAETISYEISCLIGRRVPRMFLEDSLPAALEEMSPASFRELHQHH